MKFIFSLPSLAAVFAVAAMFGANAPNRASIAADAPTPVVVELFTSEGCSSCPPADALLQKFDTQPYPGAELIVLSEHVDYWNQIGWKDPYSAPAYSERQSAYCNHLNLDGAYTPQVVVDGTVEFVGSNAEQAQKAFEKAAGNAKIPVQISAVKLEGTRLTAHIETGALPAQSHKADIVLVLALNHAESQVKAGENSGRHLTHVAVIRSLQKAGSVKAGESFSGDVSTTVEKGFDLTQFRVIAMIQEPGPGRILGAAMHKLSD
jgi:hypothetical protein